MPTRYTAGVQDGTITSFEEYAMQCARNFGATILLRDEPLSPDIPEFEPSDFHAKALAEAEAELERLQAMDDTAANRLAEAEYERELESYHERVDRRDRDRGRYESMLQQAKSFRSPTEEHNGFAEFIVSQLEESIKWECSNKYDRPPGRKSGAAWRQDNIERLQESIERHRRGHAEGVSRANNRNEWVRQLRQAVRAVSNAETPAP